MLGRNALLQFFVAASSFQDQLCIEKTISRLDDDFDSSVVETWDMVGVSVNVCDLYKDFFAADALLKISSHISPVIVKSLEVYVEQAQISINHSTDINSPPSTIPTSPSNNDTVSEQSGSTLFGVKCISVALYETVSIFRREDFPAFLKHPIGQKLSSRLAGSSNPLRGFLRASNRSPERPITEQNVTSKVSMESDRSTGDFDEEFDFAKRQKRVSAMILGNTMKMIGRMGGKTRSATEDKDLFVAPISPPTQETDMSAVEGELHGIINSEENSFIPSSSSNQATTDSSATSSTQTSLAIRKKANRLSPFFDTKVQQKTEELANSGKAFLENFRFKKGEGNSTLEKSSPWHIKSNSTANDELRSSAASKSPGKASSATSDTGSILPSALLRDADAESFIQLEIEEQQKSVPLDEDINLEGNEETLPPMLILPAKFFQLDDKLESLQKDSEDAEKQIKDAERSNDADKLKGLNYVKRGIWHEIQDNLSEKQKIERLELENVILSVSF